MRSWAGPTMRCREQGCGGRRGKLRALWHHLLLSLHLCLNWADAFEPQPSKIIGSWYSNNNYYCTVLLYLVVVSCVTIFEPLVLITTSRVSSYWYHYFRASCANHWKVKKLPAKKKILEKEENTLTSSLLSRASICEWAYLVTWMDKVDHRLERPGRSQAPGKCKAYIASVAVLLSANRRTPRLSSGPTHFMFFSWLKLKKAARAGRRYE